MWTNDCAFYRNGLQPDCIALKELDCRKCVFRKTKKELDESRAKSEKRLKELGLEHLIRKAK